MKILVTRFIPLNPTDLEGWMEDPEEWVNTEEKENDQWEYELRVGVFNYLPNVCLTFASVTSHVLSAS